MRSWHHCILYINAACRVINFEIKKICILCFFTYVLNLLIGIVGKPKDENIIQVFVTSFKDFISALKIKKYAITFIILLCSGNRSTRLYNNIRCTCTAGKNAKRIGILFTT